MKQYKVKVSNDESIHNTIEKNKTVLNIFGHNIKIKDGHDNCFGILNANEFPSKLIKENEYVETRAGVSGNFRLRK